MRHLGHLPEGQVLQQPRCHRGPVGLARRAAAAGSEWTHSAGPLRTGTIFQACLDPGCLGLRRGQCRRHVSPFLHPLSRNAKSRPATALRRNAPRSAQLQIWVYDANATAPQLIARRVRLPASIAAHIPPRVLRPECRTEQDPRPRLQLAELLGHACMNSCLIEISLRRS